MDDLRGLRALVTGASSGIGAAIARELAARGVDLVLTARRDDALRTTAAACTGVQVDIVTGDLGQPGGVDAVWTAATAGRAIDILVNNAGFGALAPFAESEWARDAEMIQLNMTSLVELARRFLAQGPPAGRRYVLNVSSIGAYQAVPNMALYAASKAFVRDFTEALHDELAGTPISATALCPGGTKTAFHEVAGAGNYGWLARSTMLSAEAVARYAVRAMASRKRIAIPGVMNKLSCWGVRLVPRRFASWLARRIMGRPRKVLAS